MEARFVKPSDPETVVGAARWAEGRVETNAEQDDVAAALRRIFRAVPVLTEDAALRSFGTFGPVVLEPGGRAEHRDGVGPGRRLSAVPGRGGAAGRPLIRASPATPRRALRCRDRAVPSQPA